MIKNKHKAKKIINIFLMVVLMGVSALIGQSATSMYAPSSTADNAEITNRQALINISINDTNGLDYFYWTWDFQEYDMYSNKTILFYNFDNVSGVDNSTHVRDLSIYGNNGTFQGLAHYNDSGKYGKSLTLHGDGVDWIEIDNSSSQINNLENFTVMVWVKSVQQTLCNAIDIVAISNANTLVPFELTTGSANCAQMGFMYGYSSDWIFSTTESTMNDGQWHHLTAVMYSSGNVSLYMDGVNQSTITGSASIASINRIGQGIYGYWDGDIDELRIINSTLNATEVQQYYYSNLYKYETNKWQFTANESNLQYEKSYNYSSRGRNSSGSNFNTSTGFHTVRIAFTPPTLNNNSNITLSSMKFNKNQLNTTINVTVSDAVNMSKFIWNWNGTNYTFYDDSIILMYNYDNISSFGESETIIKDMSLYGNNATIVAGAFIEGKYGKALYHNGTDTISTIANKESFSVENKSFAISFWINTSDPTGDIFVKGNPSFSTGWYIVTDTGNLRYRFANLTSALSINIPSDFSNNIWHQLFFNINRNLTESKVYYYRDGTLVRSDDLPDRFLNLTNDYGIVTGFAGDFGYFSGTLDELRIWNRSFTGSEVEQHYYSNLYKYKNDSWQFISNQPNLTFRSYNYFASVATSSASQENQTDIRTLNIINDTPIRINFTSPTPANGTDLTHPHTIINISINNASTMNKFIWNWNGTNYTFYDDSLIAHYSFDNITGIGENGTETVDTSLHGYNLTRVNGVAYTTDAKQGQAFYFNSSSSQYLDAGKSINFSSENATVILWQKVNISGTVTPYAYIGNGITTSNPFDYFGVYNGNAYFYLTSYYYSTTLVNDSLWHQVALTFDRRNNAQYKLYVDGVMENNVSDKNFLKNDSSFRYIGQWGFGVIYPFNGSIDEVFIYNRTLSADEVKQHYYSNLYKYSNDSWQFTSNQSNLTLGTYNYFASAFDDVGNKNKTEVRWLNVTNQNTPPTITNLLFNQSVFRKNEQINISVQYNDTEAGLGTLTFNISNQTGLIEQRTITGVVSGTTPSINFTTTFFKGNNYNVSVSASDGTNNATPIRSNTTLINNTIPTFVINSPADNFHNNISLVANFTLFDVDSDTTNVTLYVNSTTSGNHTRFSISNGSTINISVLNMNTNANFTWFLEVNDSMVTRTNTFFFFFDTVKPIITWVKPFTIPNQQYYTNNNISLNVTAFDQYLYRINITLRNSTGHYVKNILYDNINITSNSTKSLNETINFSSQGNHSIEVAVTDSHTKSDLKEKIVEINNEIINQSNIKSKKDLSVTESFFIFKDKNKEVAKVSFGNYNKNKNIFKGNINSSIEIKDKEFKFGWDFTINSKSKVFIHINTTEKISLINQKIGHFVVEDYYFDFNDVLLDGYNFSFTNINEKELEISIWKDNWKVNDKIIIDPVAGGLNTQEETVYIYFDNESPRINFAFPTPNGLNLSTSIIINITSNDSIFANTTFNIYNSSKELVNTTTISTNQSTITFFNLKDGIHFFNATSYDLAGNFNSTETRNVTMDSTSPQINFTFPTPDNNSLSIVPFFTINVSGSDTNTNNITFRLKNQNNEVINISYIYSSDGLITFSNNLFDGVYFYNVTIYDSAGNENNTETRLIQINQHLGGSSAGGISNINTTNTTTTNTTAIEPKRNKTLIEKLKELYEKNKGILKIALLSIISISILVKGYEYFSSVNPKSR